MPDVAHVRDPHTVRFHNKDDVFTAQCAVRVVVKTGHAENTHAAKRRFRRRAEDLRRAVRRRGVVVIVMIVAQADDVRPHTHGIADPLFEGIEQNARPLFRRHGKTSVTQSLKLHRSSSL